MIAGIAAARAGVHPGSGSMVTERTLAAAERSEDPSDTAHVRAWIAAALADTDPAQARRLADEALTAADRIKDAWCKADALAGIAAVLARTDPDRAMAAAGRIEDASGKADALARIAAALAGSDPGRAALLADQALAAADRIEGAQYKGRAVARIACVLAGTDPDRALAIADRIGDPEIRATAVACLIEVQADLARIPDAVRDTQTGSGLTGKLIAHVRALDPATANHAWWTFARLAITRAGSASERGALVHAVLSADECSTPSKPASRLRSMGCAVGIDRRESAGYESVAGSMGTRDGEAEWRLGSRRP